MDSNAFTSPLNRKDTANFSEDALLLTSKYSSLSVKLDPQMEENSKHFGYSFYEKLYQKSHIDFRQQIDAGIDMWAENTLKFYVHVYCADCRIGNCKWQSQN